MKNCTHRRVGSLVLGWLAALLPASGLLAAPLDALLEATPQNRHGDAMIELGADQMNHRLDILKLRNSDPSLPDNAGDYSGAHIRAGVNIHQSFWLEGSLMQRNISYSSYRPQIDSWQLAGQWQLIQGSRGESDIGLRLSAWGNRSGGITRNQTESVTLSNQSVQIQSLALSKVEDLQTQIDLVSTWRWPDTTASVFAGAGAGRVKIGTVSVQSSLGSFTYGDNFASLVQALMPSYKQQLDALNYRTRFAHAGFNLSHQLGNWRLRGGYDFFVIQRSAVDDVIASLPAPTNQAYRSNHTLVGEVAYSLRPGLSVFTRGQAMSNQFLADVPMLYNSITAKRFNQKYGLLSVGLIATF